MFIRFDRMHERDRHTHTDRQTNRQTPHDGIVRVCIASNGKYYFKLTGRHTEIALNTINARNSVNLSTGQTLFTENFQQIDPLTLRIKYITNLCIKTKVDREQNTQYLFTTSTCSTLLISKDFTHKMS